METIDTITGIAQLGGTALAIAVLIYVLAFFRGEVKTNREDLAKFMDKTLETQQAMQKAYLDDVNRERSTNQSQEDYIRQLTKDMIEVLHTNNGHLQDLTRSNELSRKELESTLQEAIEENNKLINRRLVLIAKALDVDTAQFID